MLASLGLAVPVLGTAAEISSDPGSGVGVWRMAVVLLYLCVVAGIGILLVRHFRRRGLAIGTSASSELIQLRAVRRLTPTSQAVLLEVEGKQVLVVVASSGIATTLLGGDDGS